MNKQTITPAEHARLLEKLEMLEEQNARLKDRTALRQQNAAFAHNIEALEDRVRELEAELEMMHEINAHVAEKACKEVRIKAADIAIRVQNVEMAREARRDIMNIQTPKP